MNNDTIPSEGFYRKNFGRVVLLIGQNLDFLTAIIIAFILIKYFTNWNEILTFPILFEASTALLLVTIGIAAFFGQNKKAMYDLLPRLKSGVSYAASVC